MDSMNFPIQYAGLTLQVVKNEAGDPVTPLKPISDLFGLKWEEQRKKVTSSGYLSEFLGVCTPDIRGAGDQNRVQICVLVRRVAAYLMTINPEKVRAAGNEAGSRFLVKKFDEWADAVHDWEEVGVAINMNHVRAQDGLRKQREAFARMMVTKTKMEDAADRKAVGQVAAQMAAELGVMFQLDLPEGGAR